MGPSGAKGAKWGQMGPNGVKWGQMGPNGAKWDQIGPNRAKWAKLGQMGLISEFGVNWKLAILSRIKTMQIELAGVELGLTPG